VCAVLNRVLVRYGLKRICTRGCVCVRTDDERTRAARARARARVHQGQDTLGVPSRETAFGY